VIGPEVRDWRDRVMERILIKVEVDGEQVGLIAAAINEGVFDAVRFLINLCALRGIHLPAGTFVSCGALSGIHNVSIGSIARVHFEGLGSFCLQFAERQPSV
jgi:2-keto-4-pentenoate hydratase